MFSDLTAAFPRLLAAGYVRTSQPTRNYNCVGWALNDDSAWWEPDSLNWFKWPDGVKRNYSIKNYVKLFAQHGYEKCTSGDLESGFEKVALYTDGKEFKHVARQLVDGKWTSKLGEMDDITHALDGLGGAGYGEAKVFLRRARP